VQRHAAAFMGTSKHKSTQQGSGVVTEQLHRSVAEGIDPCVRTGSPRHSSGPQCSQTREGMHESCVRPGSIGRSEEGARGKSFSSATIMLRSNDRLPNRCEHYDIYYLQRAPIYR
jgi:hypothetical protein